MRKIFTIGLLLFTLTSIAQLTFVPDNNFEQALIDQGLDDILDDFVLTSNIDSISTIDLNDLNIIDLTGIEDFVSLTNLYCTGNNLSEINVQTLVNLYTLTISDNQLENIDLTNNTNLHRLWARNNNLTSIDLTYNTELVILYLSHNSIESINLSNNPDLDWVGLDVNNLSSIDFSQNIAIRQLSIAGNQLTSLDVSSNVNLESLQCFGNMIDSLDVSSNTMLIRLFCYYNGMTYLDLRNGNNEIIQFMTAYNNPELYCIFVDDAEYSTNNWENIDENSTFVETQEECDFLAINDLDNLFYDIKIVPNPASKQLNIINHNGLKIEQVYIYNMIGMKVISSEKLKELDISHLPAGIYLVSLKIDNKLLTRKLVKE